MTTPDCTENTKWIINMDKVKISETQLNELRMLKVTYVLATPVEDNLEDNFRPVQNKNTRTVNKR